MDQWEHMRIEAVQKDSYTVELRTFSGPRYLTSHVDPDQEPGDQGLRLLDEYGKAGWELVSTHERATGSAELRVFWLRRIVESRGGMVFGI